MIPLMSRASKKFNDKVCNVCPHANQPRSSFANKESHVWIGSSEFVETLEDTFILGSFFLPS